jgi:DNA-binding response OmpR family regulator
MRRAGLPKRAKKVKINIIKNGRSKHKTNSMKILIVEDEVALSRVLQDKFRSEGFDASVAQNGEVAFTEASRIKPDIIVLDLLLPKKDGFEVLGELKADADLKMIPVIVLSNLGEDENIKRAIQLGAADYFVKTQHPINEIIEKVKTQAEKGR